MSRTLSVFPPPPRHAPRFVLATSPFDLPVACPASSFSWASLLSHRRRRLRLHRRPSQNQRTVRVFTPRLRSCNRHTFGALAQQTTPGNLGNLAPCPSQVLPCALTLGLGLALALTLTLWPRPGPRVRAAGILHHTVMSFWQVQRARVHLMATKPIPAADEIQHPLLRQPSQVPAAKDDELVPAYNPILKKYFKDDTLFTALHRAAWLGDVRVLQEVLHYEKGKPLGADYLTKLRACDDREMMPVHVAALQGHHAAVAFLLSCGADADIAESLDIDGHTALDLLMTATNKIKQDEEITTEQIIIEGREQQLWSLHKTIEITRLEHVLAAKYFSFRHFWFLFLPAALVTAFSAILSFLASSVVVQGHASADFAPVPTRVAVAGRCYRAIAARCVSRCRNWGI